MNCIYCSDKLHLHKKETLTRPYYWYGCHSCGCRTPRAKTVKLAKKQAQRKLVFKKNEECFFVGDRIKCEFNKQQVEGRLVFDEIALCYTCQPSKGIRYPMWKCTFVEKV